MQCVSSVCFCFGHEHVKIVLMVVKVCPSGNFEHLPLGCVDLPKVHTFCSFSKMSHQNGVTLLLLKNSKKEKTANVVFIITALNYSNDPNYRCFVMYSIRLISDRI